MIDVHSNPVNLQIVLDQLQHLCNSSENGSVENGIFVEHLQQNFPLHWDNSDTNKTSQILIQYLEQGQEQKLCHKVSENVWKIGARPTASEELNVQFQETQQTNQQNQEFPETENEQEKRKNKMTGTDSSRSEVSQKSMSEAIESPSGGPFQSDRALEQEDQRKSSKQTKRGVKQSYTREQLLQMLTELDEDESQAGGESQLCDKKIEPKLKLKSKRELQRTKRLRRAVAKRRKSAVSKKRRMSAKKSHGQQLSPTSSKESFMMQKSRRLKLSKKSSVKRHTKPGLRTKSLRRYKGKANMELKRLQNGKSSKRNKPGNHPKDSSNNHQQVENP